MELVSRYTKKEYMYFKRANTTNRYREYTYTTNGIAASRPQELVGKYLRVRAMWRNPAIYCA